MLLVLRCHYSVFVTLCPSYLMMSCESGFAGLETAILEFKGVRGYALLVRTLYCAFVAGLRFIRIF